MMLIYVLTTVVMAVSLILQSHPSFDVIRFAGVKPDLLFIAIIYFAYNFGSFYGQVCGFLGGIIQDSISNSPLGFLALPKLIAGFAAGYFGRSVFKGGSLTIMILILVASLVKGGISIILAMIFDVASISSIGVVLSESVYNAFLAIPLFYIFDKIFEFELSKERY